MAIGRASVTSADYPGGPADGTGTLESGGREWRFQHVNVGNPQCVIEVGDEVEELDLGGDRPARSRRNTELFPNRTNVSFTRVDGSHGPGADLRARGGGDALLGHRRQRRRGRRASSAAPRARSRSSSTAASSTVEITDELDVTLIGSRVAGLRRRARPGLRRARSR